MTRAQLINKLSLRMNVNKKKADLYLTAFLDSIMHNLNKDGRVLINKFGSFKVKQCKARIMKKPITGEIIKLPIRNKISFHPGKDLCKLINTKEIEKDNIKIFTNNIRASENILSVSS